MYYESADDVRLRLYHSIVAFNDTPVMVDEVISKDAVKVTELLTGNEHRVKITSLDLNPSSLPLGYVIADGRVFLTSRKPCRRYKQGLTQENFHVKPVLSKERSMLSVTNRAVARTMKGMFPDIGDAFKQVRNGQSKVVPFSREWAIADHEDELCLLYRGEVVGFVGDTFVRINPERSYLKESLELCLK